jgi:hypothetical protein
MDLQKFFSPYFRKMAPGTVVFMFLFYVAALGCLKLMGVIPAGQFWSTAIHVAKPMLVSVFIFLGILAFASYEGKNTLRL